MIKVKSGETITLFVETYDATPSEKERVEAGVDDEYLLYAKHPKPRGRGSVIDAHYKGDEAIVGYPGPNGWDELHVTVMPGEKELGFVFILGNSRYIFGELKCRLPDGTIKYLRQVTPSDPRCYLTIVGT